MPITDSEIDMYDMMNTFSNEFQKCIVNHPFRLALSYIPEHATEVILTNVHQMVPIGSLPNVVKFTMRSDGRFLEREGIIRYTVFQSIRYHETLQHLILDGPWLESMVDYSLGVIQSLVTIKGLKTLIIDLDQFQHGEKVIYDLLMALSNLNRFGRLGRIGKPFWKLFKKQEISNIRILEVGTIVYSPLQIFQANPEFLSNLGWGCSWTFTNLQQVSIYVGFQHNLDRDDLLEMIKDFKEGIPSLNGPKTVKRIDLFQVADFQMLNQTRWNYVTGKHGGYPMQVFVTDEDELYPSIKTGKGARIFPC
jgi:hypothetical protein